MSDEHFTVDGTLIEAWASQKSFQRKDGGTDGDGRNFRGQERKNDTHASKTDPDARLYRKSNGAESRLAYLGHLLIENRHGLIADAMATVADGYAEREAATLMVARAVGARAGAPPHGRRRQGVRRRRFRRADARAEHHAARHAEPRRGRAAARLTRARRATTATRRVSTRGRASNRRSGG